MRWFATNVGHEGSILVQRVKGMQDEEFVAVILAIVACAAFGANVTVGTRALVLASSLALAPPAITLMLWPGVQPQTAAEVLRGGDAEYQRQRDA